MGNSKVTLKQVVKEYPEIKEELAQLIYDYIDFAGQGCVFENDEEWINERIRK